MNNSRQAYIEIHVAVFIFGFAAILGELISVSAAVLIFWRAGITLCSFLFFREIYSDLKSIKLKDAVIFIGIGFIVCLHWLCFYGAIKLSNASVALIAFSTMSVFTAFAETIFLKSKIHPTDVIFGLAIIPAMALTVQSLDISMHLGVIIGVLSGLLAAVFSVLNKKHIERTGPVTITFLNMVGVFLCSCIILPFLHWKMDMKVFPNSGDWIYIFLLAIFCTTLGFVLMTRSFRYLSAFAGNFVINLEPVYGVILAIIILKEYQELNVQFYLGVIIITLLVFIYPVVKRRS